MSECWYGEPSGDLLLLPSQPNQTAAVNGAGLYPTRLACMGQGPNREPRPQVLEVHHQRD